MLNQMNSLAQRVERQEDENFGQRMELITEMVDDHKD